jgi:hypothetical protein
MNGPAVREYASEYPQKIHWKVVTAATIMDWNRSESADFLLAKPPYKRPIPGIMSQTMKAQKMR